MRNTATATVAMETVSRGSGLKGTIDILEAMNKKTKSRGRKAEQENIGITNGWYALYFAILGQAEHFPNGEIAEDIVRFPNTADAAIGAYFGHDVLDDTNSFRAIIETDGDGNMKFRPLEKNEIIKQPRRLMAEKTRGKQLSFDF